MTLTFGMSEDGDWEAVYADGELLTQGHSIGGHQLAMRLVGRGAVDAIEHLSRELTQDELDGFGCRFPERLEDVLAVLNGAPTDPAPRSGR